MADSVAFCHERHPVIAYFGWECPLCACLGATRIEDRVKHTANDLRREVVRDYNRLFYVHEERPERDEP